MENLALFSPEEKLKDIPKGTSYIIDTPKTASP